MEKRENTIRGTDRPYQVFLHHDQVTFKSLQIQS
jgi:ATP-dependent Clp protease adapter protein ClpS